MRTFFSFFAVIFGLAGFIIPIFFMAAIISVGLAIGCAPPGLRADGKPKSGGLLGGIIDEIVISGKMRDCPYCKRKIMKDAVKCPHCREWVQRGPRAAIQ